jgi:two-component system alkaline phosphatase synthesis response regulator PhoP
MAKIIYVVDDEENILEIITFNLKKSSYTVKGFGTGSDFLDEFNRSKPDLVVLDLMLPDMDGLDICKNIKSKTDIPIIILSAKSEELDKILGLELGADDYMVKPFSVRELIARIKNILKRAPVDTSIGALKKEFYFDDINLSIDEKKHEILLDNKFIKLNPKEFKTISMLLRNLNNLSKRNDIIAYVWGEDYYGDTRTLDVHIRRIREKLSYKNFGGNYIKTVHGYGYKLIDKI